MLVRLHSKVERAISGFLLTVERSMKSREPGELGLSDHMTQCTSHSMRHMKIAANEIHNGFAFERNPRNSAVAATPTSHTMSRLGK